MRKNTLEYIFYIEENGNTSKDACKIIFNILSCGFKYSIRLNSFTSDESLHLYTEIGPHKTFKTSWNTTMIDLFKKCGITTIKSIEYSILYPKNAVPEYDSMIFTDYSKSFNKKTSQQPYFVDILKDDMLSDEDKTYYKSIIDRDYTNVEIYDLMQFNSEHARHHFFKGNLIENGKVLHTSLFDRIKSTEYNTQNSIISFKDNASVITGSYEPCLLTDTYTRQYFFQTIPIHYSVKAETHNFPTAVSPFEGASTGVGGRIRDTLCVGKGGMLIAGIAGYSVGDVFPIKHNEYDYLYNSPSTILIEASNGASDYGNKIGEPLIGGFTRSYKTDYYEYQKPIMFSGGIGKVYEINLKKDKSEPYMIVGRVGGPAYRIGMGGGMASSKIGNDDDIAFNAVQRGDAYTANKLAKFIKECCSANINPLVSLHDQGAGGMANVTRELLEPHGGHIFIDNVFTGDESLGTLEKWIAEYQEQVSFLFHLEDVRVIKQIAERENIHFAVVGYVKKGNLVVTSKKDDIIPVNLPGNIPEQKKEFVIKKPITNKKISKNEDINWNYSSIILYTKEILSDISVCCKSFLTNKVDRSVGGLVVQQQCVGPYHLPLSNYSVVKSDFKSKCDLVTAIGEQPAKGIDNCGNYTIENMVRMTISEMLLNIVWVSVSGMESINCSANWMWPSISPEDGWLLNKAVDTLVSSLNKLSISINGGKDSLSMTSNKKNIKSPPTLVLTGYTNTFQKGLHITPYFKQKNSYIMHIGFNKQMTYRLGGSIFEKKIHKSGLDYSMPDINDWRHFKTVFNLIQYFLFNNYILSGHDISDGGLMTTLSEMSISSNLGFNISIDNYEAHYLNYMFSEEAGIVIEISNDNMKHIISKLLHYNVSFRLLGKTSDDTSCKIKYNNRKILNTCIPTLKYAWYHTSFNMEMKQCNPVCARSELLNSMTFEKPKCNIPDDIIRKLKYKKLFFENKYKIAILSDNGSNGESEMAFCFKEAGFDTYSINMNDLIEGRYTLDMFRGIAFVGGFTYADIPSSAYGWYSIIKNNYKLKEQFDRFYKRDNTFSFGVCNGCQLMVLLDWISDKVTMCKNNSGRFESRFSYIRIEKNNSIMLKYMEGIQFGVWSNHSEGKIIYDGTKNISPIRYIDNLGDVTNTYPYNPNGSLDGMCSLLSENGRHLAMMPHPERCIFKWQIPWLSAECENSLDHYTPWILMFTSAYEWCENIR